ncbi:inositol 2-dehydrogenase [Labrys sp. KB_33_2]|uniref:inositol 2-dehydrogenase n=1 Tax=Labrys sp. KB_33_2 TaxID=3237479 RepID=UPI003F905AA4
MVRLAVLGAGRIGKIHGRNAALHPQARLISVSDPHQPSAEALAAETGARVSTIDEAIAADDVDAVLICTPTSTHADLIERAVQAGKAVFCEKPVDLSSDRIRRCLAEVGRAGKPLMIGFNRRFDPNFATLKQRLVDGSVGEVELVTIISRDPAPPPVSYIESSGGLFRDMMIHDLDLARFLLAEEPVEVHAVASALVDPAIGRAGDVDTAAVLLKTASGKIAQISNSRRATYGYDQRIEVHGSKGLIRAHNVPKTTVEVATGAGFLADPVQDFFLERYAEAYRLEMTAFVDAILAGKVPNPSGEDGLKAQILADAATQAAQTGNAVKL